MFIGCGDDSAPSIAPASGSSSSQVLNIVSSSDVAQNPGSSSAVVPGSSDSNPVSSSSAIAPNSGSSSSVVNPSQSSSSANPTSSDTPAPLQRKALAAIVLNWTQVVSRRLNLTARLLRNTPRIF